MTELHFVNKPHNNHYYEWGKNCATLKYTEAQVQRILSEFDSENMTVEDRDVFWNAYNDGPRESGEIYSLNLIQSMH